MGDPVTICLPLGPHTPSPSLQQPLATSPPPSLQTRHHLISSMCSPATSWASCQSSLRGSSRSTWRSPCAASAAAVSQEPCSSTQRHLPPTFKITSTRQGDKTRQMVSAEKESTQHLPSRQLKEPPPSACSLIELGSRRKTRRRPCRPISWSKSSLPGTAPRSDMLPSQTSLMTSSRLRRSGRS